ncbi:mCG1037525, partial [Mus musculus]
TFLQRPKGAVLRMTRRRNLEPVSGEVDMTSAERTSFPRFLLSSAKTLPSYFRDITEIPGISPSVDLCTFVSAGWRSLERSLLFRPPVYFLWSPFPSSFLIPLATAYGQLVYKSQPPP